MVINSKNGQIYLGFYVYTMSPINYGPPYSRMQLTLHAIRRTRRVASRLTID